MSDFLETIKDRLEKAQARAKEVGARFLEAQSQLALANQKFQSVTTENNIAQQEFQAWTKSYEFESKREAEHEQPQAPTAINIRIEDSLSMSDQANAASDADSNKTELIRNVIRCSENGMTPGEIWAAVKEQIPRRNYVYAVLGRLKDREQVSVRRGKYFFRQAVKPHMEVKEPTSVIQ